ncbi:MAG: hypothetical protein LCH61_16725 [Proteobacteria bacterium]|nr:hypothetical protein [Pseudomonadota bacterium]
MADKKPIEDGIELTEAQRAARRRRSLALALAIGGLAFLFYLITVFKMGSAIVTNRTL